MLQARQLPLLAPVLPVKDPLLPSQAYDLVLQVTTTAATGSTVCFLPAYASVRTQLGMPAGRCKKARPVCSDV